MEAGVLVPSGLGLVVMLSMALPVTGGGSAFAVGPAAPPPSTAPPRTAPPSAAPPAGVVTPPSASPPSSVVTPPPSASPPSASPPSAAPPSSVVTPPQSGSPPTPAPPSATPPSASPPSSLVTPPPSGSPPTPTPPSASPPSASPPAPPGGTPPAALATPPAGGSPPSGAPVDPGKALDKAGKALSKAGELKDRADGVRDQLAPAKEEEDAEEAEDEAAPAQEPNEPAPDYVDYSNTWRESPPSTVVITRVEHRPYHAPAPKPAPSYEPRAHGFVGVSLRGTTTNHNPSALSGARVGFTFDDRFTIGGAFYSLTARFAGAIIDPEGHKLGMRMGYGGVLLGWTLYKGRVMQVGLETLAGAGAACISRSRKSYGRWQCIEKVGLVSIEPGLEVGFVVTDWVRLGVTGGYRFVTREAWRPPNDFTLSGPYVGLNVDFGAFRSRDGARR